MEKEPISIHELADVAELVVAGRVERVRIVEDAVARKRRPDHDLLRLASSVRPLRAIARAMRLLEQRRADLPPDLVAQIEAPL